MFSRQACREPGYCYYLTYAGSMNLIVPIFMTAGQWIEQWGTLRGTRQQWNSSLTERKCKGGQCIHLVYPTTRLFNPGKWPLCWLLGQTEVFFNTVPVLSGHMFAHTNSWVISVDRPFFLMEICQEVKTSKNLIKMIE